MSDIDSGLDNHIGEPIPPLREGLPARFRMRADAHYVEELDSALFSAPIRHLDVRTIDPILREGDHSPSAEFVESVRRHGVLQPLLVRSRGGRFQVMAGSKRLAAGLAARHVAESHRGRMSVDCLDGLTSLSIAVPAAK
jgi:hypothetical protein